MLIKHAKSFRLKSTSVKTAAALGLLLAATPMAAHSANITQERFSVRFEKSLTQSEAGVEKVYAMFEEKAAKVCKLGKSLNADGEPITYEQCLVEMVAQLVESADIEAVKAYHVAKTTTG